MVRAREAILEDHPVKLQLFGAVVRAHLLCSGASRLFAQEAGDQEKLQVTVSS